MFVCLIVSSLSVFLFIDYADAIECYSKAIELYPKSVCSHEIAVCYANRAACHMKTVCSPFTHTNHVSHNVCATAQNALLNCVY